jgi:hypothetical protein
VNVPREGSEWLIGCGTYKRYFSVKGSWKDNSSNSRPGIPDRYLYNGAMVSWADKIAGNRIMRMMLILRYFFLIFEEAYQQLIGSTIIAHFWGTATQFGKRFLDNWGTATRFGV